MFDLWQLSEDSASLLLGVWGAVVALGSRGARPAPEFWLPAPVRVHTEAEGRGHVRLPGDP